MKRPFCENNLVAPVSITDATRFSGVLTLIAADAGNPSLAATLRLICGNYAIDVQPAAEEEVRAQIDRVFGDYCQVCGAPTAEGLRRCDRCRAVKLPPRSLTVDLSSVPARVEGKLCPYCQTRIQPGLQTCICPLCRMPHHAECWVENGGCTTFGCNGAPVRTPGFDEPIVLTSERINPRVWYGLEQDGPSTFSVVLGIIVAVMTIVFLLVFVTKGGVTLFGSPHEPTSSAHYGWQNR